MGIHSIHGEHIRGIRGVHKHMGSIRSKHQRKPLAQHQRTSCRSGIHGRHMGIRSSHIRGGHSRGGQDRDIHSGGHSRHQHQPQLMELQQRQRRGTGQQRPRKR